MLNKDKRSLLMCLVLGDGCLWTPKNNRGSKNDGRFIVEHCAAQKDYLSWKAALVGDAMGRLVKQEFRESVNSYKFQLYSRRFRSWYAACYPGRIKHRGRIFRFIRHPEMALAIWMMDDGYIEPTIQDGILYSACLRIFSCSSTPEDHEEIIGWIKTNFSVEPRILYQRTRGKAYPFLKFGANDSMTLWKRLREFILQFDSMKHKFRYIEERYQKKCLQNPPVA